MRQHAYGSHRSTTMRLLHLIAVRLLIWRYRYARLQAVGAIEGQLDTISVHGQPYFTLYDALSGRGVRCYFSDERRAQVIAALGKKVIAHGRLRREPNGAPREMRDLDYFAVLGDPKGSLDNLPGVYAGVDSESVLRDIRRA